MRKNKINFSKGVTLVELIIVITVLIFVIGTVVSMFISVLGNQRRILNEQELFNQITYAKEYVSDLVRSAKKDASGSCLGSSFQEYNYRLTRFDIVSGFYQGVKFVTKDGVCQEFFLEDEVLKEKKDSSGTQNILSEQLKVKYARFIINGDKSLEGADGTDSTSDQPRLTFVLNVQTRDSKDQQEKIIQTTVSQRDLNIPIPPSPPPPPSFP